MNYNQMTDAELVYRAVEALVEILSVKPKTPESRVN